MKRQILHSIWILLFWACFAGAGTIEVSSSGPYTTIQAGIDAAVGGDEVVVADGVYKGNGNRDLDFKGKAITVRSANGPGSCTILCEGAENDLHRGFIFQSGETSSSVVAGFTISGGFGASGGGIECFYGSPTIRNCVISGCEAKYYGGGIDLYGSSAVIENCNINDNKAPVGGGVNCDYGSVAIRFCEITGNEATTDVGGGISSYDSSMSVKSCLIANNSARDFGGGIFLWDVACEISNCTIAYNSGADGFGGVYCDRKEAGEPTIINSILWGNGDDLWNCDGLVTYSCIGNDDTGEGNIHDDPRFTAGATYYLSHIDAGQIGTSPCVDAGSGQSDAAAIGMNLYTTRSDHSPDVGKVDMGYHRRIGVGPVPQFKLITGAVGNGTIDPELPGPGGGYYNQYAEVKLTAISSDPNVYRVLQWEEDGTVVLEDRSDPNSVYKGQTYTVVMVDADKEVEVTFEEKGERILTVSVSGSGGRLLEPPRGGSYKYRDGDVVTIKVRPNDGYVVLWAGTDRDNTLAEENTVTMTTDREVTVSFRRPIKRYVPSPQYPGIQAAITDANNGDKVIVSAGVYNPGYGDGYDFGGKAITVVSEYPDDPSATIIDCGGYSRAFTFKNGEGHESIVEGFTIINGFSGQKWPEEKPDKDVGKGWSHDDSPQGEDTAPYGNDEYMPHGLWNLLSIPPILIDMNAGQNGMDGKGGAIACFRHPDKGPSSPIIANCIFKDCIVQGGSGVDANSHDPLPELDEPLDQPDEYTWADWDMEDQAPEGVDGRDGLDGGGWDKDLPVPWIGVAFPGQDGLSGLDGFDGGDGGSAFGGALYFESGSYAKVKKCTIMNCRTIGGNAGAGGPGQNGQEGQDGQPGQDGMDGQDGGDGIDAEAGPFDANVAGGAGGNGGNAGKGGAGGAGGDGGKGGNGGDAGVGGEAFGGGIFFHPDCRVEIEDCNIIGCITKPGLGNVGSDAGAGGLGGEAGNSGEAGAPGSGGSGGSGAGEGEAGADGKDGLEAVGIATPGLPGSDSYDTDWAFYAAMGTWTQDPNSGYWSVDLSTGVWWPGFGESAWQNSPNYVDDGPWPGIPLQAEALYFYKYRVMDRQGKITNWSVPAWARVGTSDRGQPDEVPEAPEEYKGRLGALEWEMVPQSAKVDDVNTPHDESLSIWMKAKVPEQEWENRGPFLYQFKWIEWRGGRGGDGGRGGNGRPNGWRSWAGGIYYGANCDIVLSETTIGDNATRTFGVDVWGEPNVFEYNGGDGGDANDGGSGGEAAAGGDGGDGGNGGNAVGFGEAGEGGTGGIGGEGGERNGVKLPDGADGGDGGDGSLVGGNVTTTFGGGSYYDSSYNYENPAMGNFSLVPGFGCEVTQTGCAISGNLSEGSDGGGEYYRYDCTVSLKDCKVIGNSSGNSGGGQYFSGSSLVTINGCDYEDNSAAGSGGGIYCEAELVLDIDDSRFVGNSANGLQGAGGGVYWEGSRTGVAEYNKRFNDRLFDDGFPYVSHSGASYASYRGRLFGSNAVTVDKSRFVGNEGKLGGGLCFYDDDDDDDHNPDSEVTIFDCVANNNKSDYGGGFYWSGGSPTVKACRFNGNIARGGTAVWVDYASRYGTWAETQAYYWEHWWERENPYFDFAAFGGLGNVYGGGGGIFCWTSDALIEDCLVNENSSSGSGGGIYMGGGLAYPVLKNCLVRKNSSVLGGGGVASLWQARATISNCTIVDNFAYGLETDTQGRGGGLLCTYESKTSLIDSILWGNTGRNGNQIALALGADNSPNLQLTVSHSDIEGGKSGVLNEFNRELIWDSGSIISSDPCFVEPQFFLSQVGAGQTADSPCVDAGSAPASELGLGTYSTRTDSAPEGNSVVDMGYHYGVSRLTIVVIGPGTVSVDPNAGGLGTVFTLTAHPDSGYRVKSWKGTDNDPSWNINTNTVTMYTDTTVIVEFELDYNRTIDVFGHYPGLQVVIDDANNGDTIKLHEGTYVGTGFVVDKNITIVGAPYDPNLVIIDCGGEDPNSGDRGFMLIGSGQGSVVLNGVTIINGYAGGATFVDPTAAGVDGWPQEEVHEAEAGAVYGGGIVVRGNHTIVNCILRNCGVTGIHGANGTAGGDPEDDDVVSKNGGRGGWGGDAGGGGIYVEYGSPSIINCKFENCRATGANAGNGAEGWLPGLDDGEPNQPTGKSGCGGNGGDAYGGGIYVRSGSPFIKDCVFDGCTTTAGDGGDGGEGSPGADANDGGVSGLAHGGGVYCPVGTNPTFINCVIRNCGSVGGNGGNGGDAHYEEDYGGGAGGWGGLANDPLSGQEDPRKFTAYGGGVYCGGRSGAMFTDCTFSNNTARGSASGLGGRNAPYLWQQQPRKHYNVQSYGAGIFCGDSSATMFTRCTIEGNEITQNQDDPNDPNDPNDDILYYNREYTGFGGGMCLWGTYVSLITDCNITENFAPVGGGIYGYASGLRIEDSNLISNVSYAGGGVLVNNSSAIISGCEFRDNTAATYRDDEPNQTEGIAFGSGGGFYCMSTYVEVSDCNISENSALLSGGGVYFDGDIESINGPVLRNCLVAHNSAGRSGAGISSVWYAKPTISNCTIADNRLSRLNSYGGGLYSSFGSDTAVIDSILWGNFGVNGSQIALEDDLRHPLPSTVDISYSDVEEPNEVPALDLVFCIDTTGSMTGDIAAVQEAATAITNLMAEIFSDLRIGIVEYHDYPDDVNTNPSDFYDFIYNDVVAFTANVAEVLAGIDTLVAGGGNASGPEAVYSGLMHCIDADTLYVTLDAVDAASQGGWPNAESPGPGDWRIGADVKRVIVLMGDVPPKDPESYTNYTLEDIAAAAQAKLINIYSIVTAGYPSQTASAVEHFTALAEETAGATTLARDADEAVEAIMAVIHSLVAGGGIYFEGDCNVFGWEPNDPNYPWDPNDPDGPWDPGKHNINVDPNFVADYYLSWILAGQKIDSPCVDAGSAAAADVGLDTHTTRIDGVTDTGILDLGYHHREGLAKYQLTVTVKEDPNAPGVLHGTVDPNGGLFYEGTVVVVEPRPEPGYHLRGWYDVNDVLVATSRSLKVVMDSNMVFFAEFGEADVTDVSGDPEALKRAVREAGNGDTLVVAAGTYNGGIDVGGKAITIAAASPDDPDVVVPATVIDCQNSTRGFILNTREDANTVIDGLTIINGFATEQGGGAIYVGPNTSPKIVNIIIRDCSLLEGDGGAIYVDSNSAPTFGNVSISNCSVSGGKGGGIYVGPNSSVTFADCSVADCSAISGSGGAIYCDMNNSSSFSNCRFTENKADLHGGGIYYNDNSISVVAKSIFIDNAAAKSGGGIYYNVNCVSEINACTFEDCSAAVNGGGVFLNLENQVMVVDCNFIENSANYGGGTYFDPNCSGAILTGLFQGNKAEEDGGGIYLRSSRIRVADCNVVENTARRGGGLYAIASPDSEILGSKFMYNEAVRTVTTVQYFQPDPNDPNVPLNPNDPNGDPNDPNVIVIETTDTSGIARGGAIGWFAGPKLIRDCQINNNRATTSGGGIYLAGGEDQLTQLKACLLTFNSAIRDGGGVSSNWSNKLEISNCTLVDNTVAGFGGGLYASYESNVEVINSIIWNNVGGRGAQIAVASGDPSHALSSTVKVSYSDVGPYFDPNLISDPNLAFIGVGVPSLTVAPISNAETLVGMILGSGITVSNLSYTGGAEASGIFRGGLSAGIGIESGIILTSGLAKLAEPPNTEDGATGDNGLEGDPDLDELIPGFTTNDATILEFDFVSKGGDLFFNYVFASEEYNEFVNTTFNDVFGFFLDGENIALIPGASTPVSINNINGGNPYGVEATNATLYNNNDLDDLAGGKPAFEIEYDGFTNVFTAKALSVGSGMHHIKLAIADAGDHILDSGVFIQAGSFSDVRPFYPPIHVEEGSTLVWWEPNDPNNPFSWEVNSWNSASHNIGGDPNFISGYYLYQIAAGQDIDSICLDAGSDLANVLGMDTYTTRVDGVGDSDIVDIGYHYIEGPPKRRLTVTVLGGNGTVDPNSGWFYLGQEITLRAIPDDGYFPKAWFDVNEFDVNDVNEVPLSFDETLEVVMDANKAFVLEFKPPGIIKVPLTKPTIEEAMEIAGNGDRIVVSRGVHRVVDANGIDFEGKMVTLRSERPEDANWVAETIIDCQGSRYSPRRAFHFHSGEDPNTIVTGFTIRNGYQRGGAGASGRYGANPPVPCEPIDYGDGNSPPRAERGDDSPVSNSYGGGILCDGASPTIKNCVITNCLVMGGQGGDGARGQNGSWSYVPCGDPNASEQDVDDGQWGGHGGDGFGNGYGGAIACLNLSNPVIIDCIIKDNIARGGSGGAGGSGGDAEGEPGDYNGMESGGGDGAVGMGGGFGGGIYCDKRSTPIVTNSIFSNNIARQGLGGTAGHRGSGNPYTVDEPPPQRLYGIHGDTLAPESLIVGIGGGAAYYGMECNPSFANCEFSNNKAGIIRRPPASDTYSRGGGLFSGLNNTVAFSSCDFTDNLGGAIYCDPNCDVDIDTCLFQGNSVTTDGGAIHIGYDGYADVNDSSFMDNTASGNGGALNSESYSKLVDCTFGRNKAAGTGGAINAHYDYDGSDPNIDPTVRLEVSSCSFAGNEVVERGAEVIDSNGMFVESGIGWGGGVYCRDFEAMFTDCSFTDNIARSGGGLLLIDGTVGLTGAVISGNRSVGGDSLETGGGLFLSDAKATIENCTIKDNLAYGLNGSGGGIGFDGGGGPITHLVKNCLITGNAATVTGGAIGCKIFTEPEVKNCTFSDNWAGSLGGAIFCDGSSSSRIIDSIFKRCNNYAICEEELGDGFVTFSLFHENPEGDYAVYNWRTDQAQVSTGSELDATNIEADAKFVSGPFGGYYLDQVVSAAVNAGSDSAVNLDLDSYTTDAQGSLDKDQVDIGYHYKDPSTVAQYQLTVTVKGDPNAGGASHGTVEPNSGWYYEGTTLKLTAHPERGYYLKGWYDTSGVLVSGAGFLEVVMDCHRSVVAEFEKSNIIKVPFTWPTIEQAVAAAGTGDRIIVSIGVHPVSSSDGIDFKGKRVSLESLKPEDPNCVAETIIDCQGNRYMPRRAFHFHSGEDPSMVVTGFTIRNGYQRGSAGAPGSYWTPTPSPYESIDLEDPNGIPRAERGKDSPMKNGYGGAILCEGSSPTIKNCVISNCMVTGGQGGDGAYGQWGTWSYISPEADADLEEVDDGQWGGHGGDGYGDGCGGAIACLNGSYPVITDCTFQDNVARGGRGGGGGSGGYAKEAPDFDQGLESGAGSGGTGYGDGFGGVIYCENRSTPIVTNCIFENNIARQGLGGGPGIRGKGNAIDEDPPPQLDGFEGQSLASSPPAGRIAGGAAYYGSGCNPEFTGCEFRNNSSGAVGQVRYLDGYIIYGWGLYQDMYTRGGALYCGIDNTVTLSDSNFIDNQGGAVYCDFGGAGYCPFGNALTVENCLFSGSISTTDGGGIYAGRNGRTDINDSRFMGNVASGNGGALELQGDARLTNCLFGGNKAGGTGGAINAYYDTFDPKTHIIVTLEVNSSIFAGNEVVDSNVGVLDSNNVTIIDGSVQVTDGDNVFVQSGVGWGGGIFARDFKAAFNNCYFTDNVAKSGGGLLLIDGTVSIDGGLIYANKAIGGDSLELGGGAALSNTKTIIKNCTIKDNLVEGDNGSGGGIGLYGGIEPITHLIKNCLVTGNSAALEGGGISCNVSTEPEIRGCTFSDNSAGSFGGAVFFDWSSSAEIVDSIFEGCGNYAICEADSGGSSVRFSLFYDNVDGDYAVYDTTTGEADVSGGTELDATNIGKAPKFVAGPFSDYYLGQSSSPAVNSGSADADDVGMNIFTTDPMGDLDFGRVDIGYHHTDPLSVGQYKLTVRVIAGHGTLEPNEPEPIDYDPVSDSYTYYAGTVVTVSSYPDAGYRIRSWSGTINDASKSFDNMVIMLEDTDVTVEFDQPRTIYVGQDPNYTTIQHAIDDAVDGDTVVVPSGTYDAAWWKPDINIINKGITLTGTNPDYPTGGAATVLKDYMVSIFNNRGKRVVINGLTFKGGRMYIYYASPILRNCIFTDSRWRGLDAAIPAPGYDGEACTDGSNGVSVFGGAIEVYSSSPDFGNCVFSDCWVRGGNGGKGGDCDPYGKDGGWGGKAYGGAVYIDPGSNATFTDCTFTRCYARGGDGGDGGNGEFHGGRGGSWEWADSIDTGPGTPGWGWWDGWSWGPYDKDGYPRYNYEGAYGFYDDYWRYSGYGGAVHSRSKGLVKFIGCIFTDNHSIGGISGMGGEPWRHPDRKLNIENFGGAVYATGGDLEFIDCTLSKCTADTSVVEAPDDVIVSYGGALAFEDVRSVRLENCKVSDSRAAIGGGVYWSKTDATIVDCTITGSTAYHGGGLYSTESTGSITGSMIAENEAVNIGIPSFADANGPYEPNDPNRVVEPFDSGVTSGEGGGYCCLSSIVDINDSAFDENRASASGGGIYFSGSDLDNYFEPTVTNCLITNNTARRDGGGISSNLYAGPVISNSTIADNTVSDPNGYGGGLYCSYNSTAEVINSVIYGNRGGSGAQLAVGSEDKPYPLLSLVKIIYSDIGPGYDPDEVAVPGVIEPELSGDGGSKGGGGGVLIEGETIYGQLETGEGKAKVIVSLVEPAELRAATDWMSSASVDQLRAEVASRQLSVLRGLGPDDFTLRYRYENQAGFSGAVTASGLAKLLNNSLVAHIEPVRYVRPALAQAIPLGNASAAQKVYGGAGVAVAIVDSGVDYTHPMLGDDGFPNDKVIGGYDTGNDDADPMPVVDPHGTCCAGIAAGNLGFVGDYIGGVSPDAKIYALKMVTDEGVWPTDSGVASWDWCVTHWNDDPDNPIKVISNSWGMWGFPFDDQFVADAYSPALTTAADNATAVGIAVLAASGNDGFAGEGIAWPAAMSKVISVGAVFDTTDQVTGYSDTAENLDILAPADPVYTTDIAGPAGYTAGDYFPYFGGTSSACPFAAGAVASLQSAALAKTGSYLTPAQIKYLLVTTGDPVTDTKVDITKPRVNLGLAIAGIVYGAPVHVEDGCRLNEIVAHDWDPTALSWSTDSHNIDGDPWFIADYYLSYIDAGQDVDSPCIDAGSDVSGEFFTGWYTTRTDEGLDKGIVDLGYHRRFGQTQPCRFVDLVYDGVVDFADLDVFSSNWGREDCSVDNDYCDGTDLNFDGYVDFKDFAFFADCQLVEDDLAPIPNPSEWEIEPYLLATEPVYKASMTAKIAIDGWGFAVEYRFQRTDSDGKPNGTLRDWDPSRTYVDETLSGGKTGYRVNSRDVLGNETEWSVIRYVMTEDKVPPEPDPLTWVVVPYATSESSIRMEADTAFDTSGVEYYFDCVTPDGHDSGWQSSPVYEDVGLASNTTYTYRVRARDRSLNQNQTAWSVEASATTLESTVPDPMAWAVVPIATGTASIYMAATEADDVGQVEYYFECTDGGGHDSGWQAGASYEDTGLEADKTYTYRVRARDKSQPEDVTGWSTALSATTFAVGEVTTPTPNPSQWAEGGEPHEVAMDWNCSATMTAETADATGGVEYFFECFDDHRFDSGWQIEPEYTVVIGSCGQGKRFRVKARDILTKQNETGWSPLWPAW